MSVYERRFNYVHSVNGQGGGISCYTDSVQEVLGAIAEGGVAWITTGYADVEDVPERPGRIGGTLYTRRTDKSYTPEEFAVEFADAAALEQAIRYWAQYGVSREDVMRAEAHRLAMREEAPSFAAALDHIEKVGLAVKEGADPFYGTAKKVPRDV